MLPIILVSIDLIGYSPPTLTAYANARDCLAALKSQQKISLAEEAAAAKKYGGELFAVEKKVFFTCLTKDAVEHLIR